MGNQKILTANYIFIFFIGSALISFLFSLTGFYNGDFLGEERTLGVLVLIVLLMIYLLPYIVIWNVYKRFKYNERRRKFSISVRFMYLLLIIYFIYTLIIIMAFGVGKAEAEIYSASGIVKFVIQITNRFSFGYFSLFVLFISRNKYYDIGIILMTIAIGLLNASIGSFLFVGLTYTVKYNNVITKNLKAKLFYIAIFASFIPSIVSQMYSYRSVLRNSDYSEIYGAQLIFGKFVGRVSSFSNFAVMVQELPFFIVGSQTVDELYFQKQALKALIGVGEDPRESRPEFLMKATFNQSGSLDPNSAFMISSPGNLLFSFLKSPFILFINFLNYFIYIYVIFFLAKLINVHNGFEFAFLLIVYPITSGVSNEFVIVITSLISILILKLLSQIFISHNTNIT